MGKEHERRSTYFIKKWFQVKFILNFIMLLVIGLVISATLLYVMSNQTIKETMSYGHYKSQLRNTCDLLLPSLIKTTLISAVVISLLGIIIFLRASHHIAGPLYRFEKSAERISQGDLTETIKLRSYDEMTALGDKFTHMTQTLNQQITDIQRKTSELSALAEKLETHVEETGSPETKKLTGELNKAIDEIKTSVNYFKV